MASLKLAVELSLKFNIPLSSKMGFKEWHQHARKKRVWHAYWSPQLPFPQDTSPNIG